MRTLIRTRSGQIQRRDSKIKKPEVEACQHETQQAQYIDAVKVTLQSRDVFKRDKSAHRNLRRRNKRHAHVIPNEPTDFATLILRKSSAKIFKSHLIPGLGHVSNVAILASLSGLRKADSSDSDPIRKTKKIYKSAPTCCESCKSCEHCLSRS